MTREQQKIRAFNKFKKLERHLLSLLGGEKKAKIIGKIEKETPKGGEKESIFVKSFLCRVLFNYFRDSSIEVIIEGVNSEGRTQFRSKFFNSKPAVDFLFEKRPLGLLPVSHTILFPLETVGEVKYGNLNFRSFATGLGQIIGYLKASQFEAAPKIYGYYIFFNTDVDKTITENDKKFLEELWENENIFVVII
jgi:hypothetical protein